jgi:hypothetical protein
MPMDRLSSGGFSSVSRIEESLRWQAQRRYPALSAGPGPAQRCPHKKPPDETGRLFFSQSNRRVVALASATSLRRLAACGKNSLLRPALSAGPGPAQRCANKKATR